MKLKITKTFALLTIVVILTSFSKVDASDSIEWNISQTLEFEETAIDFAMSADGKLLFVLTEPGKIIIYSSPTEVKAQIDVGEHVDQIKVDPRGETLILHNRGGKTLKIVSLQFIQNINVSGSPFKGPENAPVVVAVFNDFE